MFQHEEPVQRTRLNLGRFFYLEHWAASGDFLLLGLLHFSWHSGNPIVHSNVILHDYNEVKCYDTNGLNMLKVWLKEVEDHSGCCKTFWRLLHKCCSSTRHRPETYLPPLQSDVPTVGLYRKKLMVVGVSRSCCTDIFENSLEKL